MSWFKVKGNSPEFFEKLGKTILIPFAALAGEKLGNKLNDKLEGKQGQDKTKLPTVNNKVTRLENKYLEVSKKRVLNTHTNEFA